MLPFLSWLSFGCEVFGCSIRYDWFTFRSWNSFTGRMPGITIFYSMSAFSENLEWVFCRVSSVGELLDQAIYFCVRTIVSNPSCYPPLLSTVWLISACLLKYLSNGRFTCLQMRCLPQDREASWFSSHLWMLHSAPPQPQFSSSRSFYIYHSSLAYWKCLFPWEWRTFLFYIPAFGNRISL